MYSCFKKNLVNYYTEKLTDSCILCLHSSFQAGGVHPTGMLSCFVDERFVTKCGSIVERFWKRRCEVARRSAESQLLAGGTRYIVRTKELGLESVMGGGAEEGNGGEGRGEGKGGKGRSAESQLCAGGTRYSVRTYKPFQLESVIGEGEGEGEGKVSGEGEGREAGDGEC